MDFGTNIKAELIGDRYIRIHADQGATSFDAIVDHDLTGNDIGAKEYMSFADAFANVPSQGTNANTIRIYLRTNNGAADETVVIPAGYNNVYIEGRYAPVLTAAGGSGATQMDQLTFSGASAFSDVWRLVLNGITVDDLSYGANIAEVWLMNSVVYSSHANTDNAELNFIDCPQIRIPSFVSTDGSIGIWANNTFFGVTQGTSRPNSVSGAMIIGNKFLWSSGTTWNLEMRFIGFPSNDDAEFTFSDNYSRDVTINLNGVTGTGSLYGTVNIHDNDFSSAALGCNQLHANRVRITGNQLGTGGIACGFGNSAHLSTIITNNQCAYIQNDGYFDQVIANNFVSNGASSRIHLYNTHKATVTGNILPLADASVSNRGAIWVNLGGSASDPHCSIVGNTVRGVGGTAAPAAQRNAIEVDADSDVDYAATVNANNIWWSGGSPLHANYYAIRFGANGGVARLRAWSNVGRTGTIIDDDSGVASVNNSFGTAAVGGGSSGFATINGHVIEDEGTPLTQRANMNFVGAGVTVTDSAPDTVVTIPGGGHVIEDEGVAMPAQPNLNFVGAGVTVTDSGPDTIVTIPGGGGGGDEPSAADWMSF